MRKKVKTIIGTLLIFVVTISIIVYQYFDANDAITAFFTTRSFASTITDNAPSFIVNSGNLKKGILAKLYKTDKNLDGLWVWDIHGLEYYKTSNNITFNTFSICQYDKWKETSATITKSANGCVTGGPLFG